MDSPVLAAIDVSQIIGVSVLFISMLSWLVNVVKGNTPDGTPRAKPKPKPQSGRSEIEALLQQLSGEKPKPKPKSERRDTSKPERRDSSQPRPKSQQDREKGKPKPPVPRTSSSRPASGLADTQLGRSDLGGEVRSHHLGNRIEASVQQDISAAVQRDIEANVQRDLGNRMALPPAPEKTVHPLVKVLRDPNGMRQAILLNEILQPPKSRRR